MVKKDDDSMIGIAVVSGNRNLCSQLASHIKSISAWINIYTFSSESSFMESIDNQSIEIVFLDISGDSGRWRDFNDLLHERLPGSLLILIISGLKDYPAAEMIRSGIYDVIPADSLDGIETFIVKLFRDAENVSNLRYLKREKEFYDHIVNYSRSMLSIINRKYEYEKVNATFCNAHNLKFESVIGKTLAEVWGNEIFRKNIKKNIDLCFNGNTVRYEADFTTPFFGSRYYEVVFRPFPETDGKISFLLAETVDISKLKESQKIMSEMEAEFKKIESNLPIGYLRCKPDGTIIHANKAFLRIVDCGDESSLADINIRAFYSEKSLFEIHIKQLRTDYIKTFGRVPMITLNGEEIACRISAFIVADDSENAAFIDFALEDSTRELMLENRLLQAQKLETIGALAGGLAHDFNNILATIYGYSEMLLEEINGNPELSDKVRKIFSAITRARSLTTQILTFSRHLEQEKIPVNIYKVLVETIAFLESGKPSNIKIHADITDSGIEVLADPTQLFRVFLNLITNSFQAMEESGGTLTIELGRIEGSLLSGRLTRGIVADEYAFIVFRDTGIGMEPSVMQRIFEPYFTTREVGKGTGLGLSVVHGIVAEIEGEILVESRKNEGTVFYLYLPVLKEDTGRNDAKSNKRLLVITGETHESKILSFALENSGYMPEFVADMARLTAALNDSGSLPDVIIYMDDSENIKPDDLKAVFAGISNKIPLILITEEDHYASKENLLNSGIASQVLIKPVSLKEISNAIQMAIT